MLLPLSDKIWYTTLEVFLHISKKVNGSRLSSLSPLPLFLSSFISLSRLFNFTLVSLG